MIGRMRRKARGLVDMFMYEIEGMNGPHYMTQRGSPRIWKLGGSRGRQLKLQGVERCILIGLLHRHADGNSWQSEHRWDR